MKETKQMTLLLDTKVHDSNNCPTLKHIISSHLIFYSLKKVVKRNCVQSSYTYMQIQ